MLDSKASIGIYENSTDRLLSSQINTIWNVDPDPDQLTLTTVHPTLWLNVAAEIAHEETSDPFYRTVIWRDYHFQLIHHLVQSHARKLLCHRVMYGGMGFTEPELRNKGGIAMFLSGGEAWSRENNSIFTFMVRIWILYEYLHFLKNILICRERSQNFMKRYKSPCQACLTHWQSFLTRI